jgi:fibronectin type 3 domain-containing protein
MNKPLIMAIAIAAALILVAGPSPSTDRNALRGRETAAAAEWSNPVDISPTQLNMNADARIVTNASGSKAYAIWEESYGGPKKVYFTTNESGSWKPTENITVHEVGEYPGPEINLDNDGNVLAAYQVRINGNYELVFRQRKNGVWSPAENFTNTPTGGSQSVSILVDRTTSDLYVIWQDDYQRPSDDAVYWKCYLSYKNKGVGSWIYSGLIQEPTGRCYFPVADIDAKGRIHLTFDNRAPGKAIIQYAQNATPKIFSAWTSPQNVSENTGLSFSYSKMACDNAGNVYAVWTQEVGTQGNIDIFFRKRIDGHWRPIENVSNTPGYSTRPSISVNKLTGKVYIAWTEQTGDTEATKEIYYRESEGAGWSAVQNMSKTSVYSDWPTVFGDQVGGVHLVYTDMKTGYYHIYYRTKRGEGLCYPPTDLAVASRAASEPRKKANTLTWKKNPANDALDLVNYKIYRKERDAADSTYKLLATLGPKTYEYKDPNLVGVELYTYKATGVAKGGHESAEFATADDQLVPPPFFPPVDLAVASVTGDGIYLKNNTLTWKKNVRNKASEVAKYRIYRKPSGSDDAAYVLAAEVGPAVFSYKDTGLDHDQRYTYAAASYSVYAFESDRSASVTDIAVYVKAYPPLAPALSTRLETATWTKMNVLTWRIDPRNNPLPIVSVRIYRRAESEADFRLVAASDQNVRRFSDYGLATGVKYIYQMTTYPEWKVESEPTAALAEERVFPPANILFEKVVNAYLLHKETVNKLSWSGNPLNDPITVANYRVYRRKATEGNSAFALLATVNADVFEFVDRELAAGEAYVYRITSLDGDGRESDFSAIFGED